MDKDSVLYVVNENWETENLNQLPSLNCRLMRITFPSKRNFERLQNNILMITDENLEEKKPQDIAVGFKEERKE